MFNAYLLVITKQVPLGLEHRPSPLPLHYSFMHIIPFVIHPTAPKDFHRCLLESVSLPLSLSWSLSLFPSQMHHINILLSHHSLICLVQLHGILGRPLDTKNTIEYSLKIIFSLSWVLQVFKKSFKYLNKTHKGHQKETKMPYCILYQFPLENSYSLYSLYQGLLLSEVGGKELIWSVLCHGWEELLMKFTLLLFNIATF